MLLRGKNCGNWSSGKSNGRVHHRLIAGILILINEGFLRFLARIPRRGRASIPGFVTDIFSGLAAVGTIFAILVIVGAILIYVPGKETIGGILVIIFSILSIVIGGSFLIGLILGIIGGALGLAKK